MVRMMTNAPGDGSLPEGIVCYLQRSPLFGPQARAIPLTGDASDRRYFRVLEPGKPTTVLALHSAPFDFDTLPFVNVARLLAQAPLPVPEILDHADDLGVLALDDLGDVTLQAHLGVAALEHRRLYREAVGYIEVLQRRGQELMSDTFIPYTLAFDVEKFQWEMDFFVKHFVEGYRGARLTPGEREAIRAEFRPLIEELAAEPRVLCHRDYHSRNLMLHRGQLFIIDFQDARMGPDTYDLVSLLRDSYADFTEEAVSDLIAYFLALHGRDAAYEADFERRFDLMSVQRNLKALGTFGYQTAVRHNPVYIQYIPRTLRYAQRNLRRYPRFARLHELLANHIEELR
jgi:aminoglycoside/choline kinase family phosphotransferase